MLDDEQIKKIAADARRECLNVALKQYEYWRDTDLVTEGTLEPVSQLIRDLSVGATGASANIVAEILRLGV